MTGPQLVLGTAQLGAHYGVANRLGRPSPREVERILRTALDLGVESLDTAPAYGDAEALVGRFLKASGWQFRIGTKLSRLAPDLEPAALRREVGAAIDRSRKRLGCETIDAVSIHDVEDLRTYGSGLVDALIEQYEAGAVDRLGASLYDAEDAALVLSHTSLRSTQYPLNVFERRFVQSGTTERLRLAGHELHARSVLLQGLLGLPPQRGEAAVPGAGPFLSRFGRVCAQHGVEPAAAAIGYAAARSAADALVVGAETADQLAEIVAALRQPLSEECLRELDVQLADVPAAVRDPRGWPRAA